MAGFVNFIIRKVNGLPLLFLGFWCFVAVLYLPAFKGGFYEDFIATLDVYNKCSFYGFLRQTQYSLYYGANFFSYCCITLFQTKPLPWFLLFTGLHAMNALLQVRFFTALFRLWNAPYPSWVPVTGALIWLLTPLAAETVNWKACSQYLVSMALLLTILKWLVDYLTIPRRDTLVKLLFTYALSTFFLEYFYLTPVFALIIIATFGYAQNNKNGLRTKNIAHVVAPMIAIWGCYYLLLYRITGRTTPHANFDLSQLLHPKTVAGKLNKFIIHTYFMEYFLPAATKATLYRILASPVASLSGGILLLLTVIISVAQLRKAASSKRVVVVLLLLFLSSFILILPSWFFEIFSYQGSRYFYLSGSFGYMLCCCILFHLKLPVKVRMTIAGIYIICCIAGTLYLVKNIRDAAQIMDKVTRNFKWDKGGTVLLLNLPTLYRGIGIVGAGDPSNFAYHLEVLQGKKTNSRFYDVSSFNMAGRWDGAHVQVIDSLQLKIGLNQGGTWWWFGGFGAADYENELYKVHFIDNGASYLLRFKQRPNDSTILLYQSGGDWKPVDWHKKGEQW